MSTHGSDEVVDDGRFHERHEASAKAGTGLPGSDHSWGVPHRIRHGVHGRNADLVEAARAVEPPRRDRPVIGMTSLGSSCLFYMKLLKPALEKRGFEVAIFHATGMGGMAFENLAAEGAFAAVMDFALPELGNLMVARWSMRASSACSTQAAPAHRRSSRPAAST